MTKSERGSLDWYRGLCQIHWSNDQTREGLIRLVQGMCQMHWSNGLLSMLSDDLIYMLSGQGARMVLTQNN